MHFCDNFLGTNVRMWRSFFLFYSGSANVTKLGFPFEILRWFEDLRLVGALRWKASFIEGIGGFNILWASFPFVWIEKMKFILFETDDQTKDGIRSSALLTGMKVLMCAKKLNSLKVFNFNWRIENEIWAAEWLDSDSITVNSLFVKASSQS